MRPTCHGNSLPFSSSSLFPLPPISFGACMVRARVLAYLMWRWRSRPTHLTARSGGSGTEARVLARSTCWWLKGTPILWTHNVSDMRRKKGDWEKWWLFPFIWGIKVRFWEWEKKLGKGDLLELVFLLQSLSLLVTGKRGLVFLNLVEMLLGYRKFLALNPPKLSIVHQVFSCCSKKEHNSRPKILRT